MAKRKHIFNVSSEDSKNLFPENTSTDFTVELPENVLLGGLWECHLLEIFFKEKITEDIFLFCDLCDEVYTCSSKLPVLRFLPQNTRPITYFTQPISNTVSREEIKRIRIYIRTPTLEIPSFLKRPVRCTLLLNKIL